MVEQISGFVHQVLLPRFTAFLRRSDDFCCFFQDFSANFFDSTRE